MNTSTARYIGIIALIMIVAVIFVLYVNTSFFSTEYSTYPAAESWPPEPSDLIGLTNGTVFAPHYWQGWNPGGIQIFGPHTNAYQFTYTLPQQSLSKLTSFHLLWYNTYQKSHTPDWILENTYLIVENETHIYQPTSVEEVAELPGVYPYQNENRGQHIIWNNISYSLTNERSLTFTVWTDPGPYQDLWTHCFTPYFHKDIPDFNGDGSINDRTGYTASTSPATTFSSIENTPDTYEAIHWMIFQKE